MGEQPMDLPRQEDWKDLQCLCDAHLDGEFVWAFYMFIVMICKLLINNIHYNFV
ncbi:protein of unknown function [Nitrosotalea devaniterrae]|uniref:Uncharacterized protein n=1 Tax=Nitrosotalea devaniterrae TaxID=1078905 RepID=A0A128A3B4_9ARCH|nr:protein of unknown function [Candidatus Nitrosotalea devanaterra]